MAGLLALKPAFRLQTSVTGQEGQGHALSGHPATQAGVQEPRAGRSTDPTIGQPGRILCRNRGESRARHDAKGKMRRTRRNWGTQALRAETGSKVRNQEIWKLLPLIQSRQEKRWEAASC